MPVVGPSYLLGAWWPRQWGQKRSMHLQKLPVPRTPGCSLSEMLNWARHRLWGRWLECSCYQDLVTQMVFSRVSVVVLQRPLVRVLSLSPALAVELAWLCWPMARRCWSWTLVSQLLACSFSPASREDCPPSPTHLIVAHRPHRPGGMTPSSWSAAPSRLPCWRNGPSDSAQHSGRWKIAVAVLRWHSQVKVPSARLLQRLMKRVSRQRPGLQVLHRRLL